MPTYSPVIVNNRELSIPKSIVKPDLGAKTVLTNEPWDFVELALVRQKMTEAKYYWQQAREFYGVAQGLPIQSAPLLLYYSFMNATKALLASKGIAFNPYHGVKEWKVTAAKKKAFTVGVTIKSNTDIVPSLATYYGETEPFKQHLLKDIFFNLPFIHRTYCLTYKSQKEMFIPLVKPRVVFEDGTCNVFVAAELSAHYCNPGVLSRLPSTFIPSSAPYTNSILSTTSVTISSPTKPTASDIQAIAVFVQKFREDLYYINGVQTLWYLKGTVNGGNRIKRQTTTLTLAAMHRLSEVCRYAPMELSKYLEGQKNWLLSEFIRMSGTQFIDEIASEITGKQFLIPNVRPAN